MRAGERWISLEGWTQLIQSIFTTRDEEILCSEFFDRLPRFVDLQVSGQDAATLLPEVSHHLGQCPECKEVYEALLEAAQAEGHPGSPLKTSPQP